MSGLTVHEFGADQKKVILLLHPSVVTWEFFELVIPLLKAHYHLIVPAIPGYDEENPKNDYTSVEEIAQSLALWLREHEITEVDVLYGCSMGGSIVLRMLAEQKVMVKAAVCDGAITPYQLPWIVTRILAVRDFLMISMGKIGGLKLLEKAFSTDEYSKTDLMEMAKILRFISYKTIWRTFESCNNYAMPETIPKYRGRLQYWYGDKEAKDRAQDIRYVKAHFPRAEFLKFDGMGHAGMALLHPHQMAEGLANLAKI